VTGLLYLTLGVAGFLTPETAVIGHETSRAVWIFSVTPLPNLVPHGRRAGARNRRRPCRQPGRRTVIPRFPARAHRVAQGEHSAKEALMHRESVPPKGGSA